ncbi:putative protease [Alteribacillus persepolensis]|uniref:Putative protease n=1 Tax=Alteribacillus persepolensis TaxID=568899 RepID=A0A1G8DKU6_9BACI|nr:U32 family peptidase [Alteribacillus persepolensis]SDH58258.1 putative protease [Alteribacillus persepolensis]
MVEAVLDDKGKEKQFARKKPELLLPAGNLEKLKTAVHYGADAVYIGGREFGLRSNAGNFSLEEMKEGAVFAKKYNASVYVTTNIYAHNENMSGLKEYLQNLESIGVAGIIVADPFIIEMAQTYAPNLEVHLSTQQSLANWLAVKFWKEQGLERVVLAREVSLQEMLEIKRNVDIEIETFVHGAMCISYSGRCVLSNHMTARDSNRGGCCQSCRWNYDLVQHTQNKETPLYSEDDVPFSMSPKDLNLIESIPKLIEAGIDSLKVEGRMKSIHYIATVASVYRNVIDEYCRNPEVFQMKTEWIEELNKCANRKTAPAFFENIPSYKEQLWEDNKKASPYQFTGVVLDYDDDTNTVTLQQRNIFKKGDIVEFFGPEGNSFKQRVRELYNDKNKTIDAARHPLQVVKFEVEQKVQPWDMMRKYTE